MAHQEAPSHSASIRRDRESGGFLVAKHQSERRTEAVAEELLEIQGWPTSKPPKGRVIRQNEYKSFPSLASVFKGRSKTGEGDAYPDFLPVSDGASPRPLMVLETKPDENELTAALDDAEHYALACMAAGHDVVVVGVAGQEKEHSIRVGVRKFVAGTWEDVVHRGQPISWVPTPEQTERLLASPGLLDLAPEVPDQQVLADRAERINRILREANIKDEYRPAYVGAMMLALWYSKGALRKDPRFVLSDINGAAQKAFEDAGKEKLGHSLRVDEANGKLAASAWEIVAILEKLNVVTASFEHDYLGHLYEAFFRHTGGNTIGQYFTPRHVARMMADICETTQNDVVIDPACGTGGFLIAAMQRTVERSGLTYEDSVDLVRHNLIGYESEPVTAALCVANMLLRGDGKTGIRKADCFNAKDFPQGECQVALMNPPFPHKKTDVPPQKFVERALKALEPRGKLAVILPTSLLVKGGKAGAWREKMLKQHSLVAVCQLPDELFQPYASATTCVVVLEKGVPHSEQRQSVFVRLQYDGYTLKKGVRVERADGRDQTAEVVDVILNRTSVPGFSGLAKVAGKDEWGPGAYIEAAPADEDEVKSEIDDLIRRWTSFYVRYAPEIANQRARVNRGELVPLPYRQMCSKLRLSNAASLPAKPGTVGGLYEILYGQKELHSRDGIPPGDTLIISPTEQYNGTYGWLHFEDLIAPAFVTAAQTGSIGEAFVQTEPCGVNDDCLILLPRPEDDGVGIVKDFIAAAVIRLERWRFTYGRKLTPARIAEFPMPEVEGLDAWVANRLEAAIPIAQAALSAYGAETVAVGGHGDLFELPMPDVEADAEQATETP